MKQQKTYTQKMPPIALKSSTNTNHLKGQYRMSTFMPKLPLRSMTKEFTKRKHKKSEPFGEATNKEELYEETILLKKTVNKLKVDLAEAKSEVVKTELNLRKKEKLIEDLTKENQTEESKNENKKRGRESTLASLIQKNYKTLRNGYRILEDENKNLKADLKSTKIKESQLEADILIEEMQKIKKLYQHSQENNANYRKQIEDLNEFKTQFYAQHKIIQKLQENEAKANDELMNIKTQYEDLFNKYNKKEENIKKQELIIKKLKHENEKFLKEKKDNEKYFMAYSEYQSELKDLKDKYEKSEKDYKKCESENNSLKKVIKNYEQKLKIPENPTSKEYNMNNGKMYESKMSSLDVQKTELMHSLVKDLGIKCKIYEKYIKKNGGAPSDVLKQNGYQGVIGSASEKVEEQLKTESSVKSNNIVEIESNDEEFKSFEYMLIKSLEANNTTKETISEAINKINTEGNQNILEDIVNTFNTYMINGNDDNKALISKQFSKKYEELKKKDNDFIEYINQLISQIKNYAEDEKNQEDKLNNYMLIETESLSNAFQKQEPNIMTYNEFNAKFIKAVGDIKEEKEVFDYLIYKMKKQVKDDLSLYDLNINILVDILEQMNNDSKSIDIIMNTKKKIEEKNIENISQLFENKEKIDKNELIEILEKQGINYNEKEKEELFRKYIIAETNDINISEFIKDLNN